MVVYMYMYALLIYHIQSTFASRFASQSLDLPVDLLPMSELMGIWLVQLLTEALQKMCVTQRQLEKKKMKQVWTGLRCLFCLLWSSAIGAAIARWITRITILSVSKRTGPQPLPPILNRLHWKKVQDKGLGAPCREKPLEKSGLEPAAPNRPTDQKHCALSTHPNPHLRRWGFGWVDKAQCFRSARRFGAAGSSPDFSRGFSRHGAPRPLSWTFFQCTLLPYPGQPSYS